MAEDRDLPDERLKDYAARWRAHLPEPADAAPVHPLRSPRRRRDLVWLAAAVTVAIALGATIWATRLLDDPDRGTPHPIGPAPRVGWAVLDPTQPRFDAETASRYSTLAVTGDLDLEGRPGSTLTFEVTLTSARDLSLSPCPDFTISQRFSDDDETVERHGLNCEAVPYKEPDGAPYLPAGQPVTFAMEIVAPEVNVPHLTWTLQNPGKDKVVQGELLVGVPAAPAPRSGYCATLRFQGQEYELSQHQFGEAPGQPLGAAEGLHCGDSETADLQAYTMSEEVGSEVIVVQYADGPLSYVQTGETELTPVPYPEVIRSGDGDVRDADISLARHLAAFTVTPTARLRDLVRFGPDGTSLRVGASARQIQPGALADETSWSLAADGFAGRDGELNALQPLRDHLLGRLHPPERTDGNLTVSEGEVRRCAGPAIAAPAGLDGLRHLAIQPAPDSLESCLDWFSVDLYLDPAGRVQAVRLDLWEP